MDIQDWVEESIINIRSDGFSGIQTALYPVYKKGLHQLFKLSPSGELLFEREWDVLIILDGCRVDVMKEVAPDISYIDTVSELTSVDTMTREWMKKNFNDSFADEMAQTAFICGNPHSDLLLEQTKFYSLEEVWKYGWDHELGTVPPRRLTDQAISLSRDISPPQMIIHYMQPHYPFITEPELCNGIDIDRFGELPWDNIWERLQKGEVEKNKVWRGYRKNLSYVLDEIEILLNNIDAEKVVITSDHGNAIGEWGIYGHPIHMPLKVLQTVPWIETSASDSGTYTPDQSQSNVSTKQTDPSVKSRLLQLGYR